MHLKVALYNTHALLVSHRHASLSYKKKKRARLGSWVEANVCWNKWRFPGLLIFFRRKRVKSKVSLLDELGVFCNLALALSSPRWVGTDNVFHSSLPLTFAGRVPVGSEMGFFSWWSMAGKMTGPNISASMDGGRHYGRKSSTDICL